MIWRVVKIFLLLLLVATITIFVGGDFGIVRVEWLGYLFETSILMAAALFWALVELVRLILSALFSKRRTEDE